MSKEPGSTNEGARGPGVDRVALLQVMVNQLAALSRQDREQASTAARKLARAEDNKSALEQQLQRQEEFLQELQGAFEDRAEGIEEIECEDPATRSALQASLQRLRQELADSHSQLERSLTEASLLRSSHLDVASRLASVEEAYANLYDKIVTVYRQVQADDAEALDLAEFIARLRSENLELVRLLQRARVREAAIPSGGASTATMAGTDVAQAPIADPAFERASEELLAGLEGDPRARLARHWIHSLQAMDSQASPRAASRLIESFDKAAMTLVALAAAAAPLPLRPTLLVCLGGLKDEALIPVPLSFFSDDCIEVRLAALDAAATVAAKHRPPEPLPAWWEVALEDQSPAVRRKALLHLAGLRPRDLLSLAGRALGDSDAEVRRVAVAALGADPCAESLALLLPICVDDDLDVRQRATATVCQILGAKPDFLASQDDDQRWRGVMTVLHYLQGMKSATPSGRTTSIHVLRGRLRSLWQKDEQPVVRAEPLPREGQTLDQVKALLMASLKGCTTSEIAYELARPEILLLPELEAMVQSGLIMRRGQRHYLP